MEKKRAKIAVKLQNRRFAGQKHNVKTLRWLVKCGLSSRAARTRKEGWRKHADHEYYLYHLMFKVHEVLNVSTALQLVSNYFW